MKLQFTILALFLGLSAQAKDVVLVSGFDPFGGARINHSWIVAQSLAQRFQNDPQIEIHTCLLPTTYAGAFPRLEECYARLPAAPAFVLSIGEGPCELNLETQVYNLDHNPKAGIFRRVLGGGNDPDNDGVRRIRQAIIRGVAFNQGLRVDVGALYCALSPSERETTVVSATPGNFVCNNAAFQFTYRHPEVPYTFAHVVGQECRNKPALLLDHATKLEKVIRRQVELVHVNAGTTPHPTNSLRMPVKKFEVAPLLQAAQGCEREFYTKLNNDMMN